MSPSIIVDDRDGLVKAFVSHIEQAAVKAIGSRGRFTMAVTGGRDAQVLLPRLASAAVDWARTDVFWGDERNVAPDDPDSNYGQIKGAWLDHAPLPAANVHRMAAEAADLERAAEDYAALLAATLGPSLSLDVCVLGVGPDGHVCSIFPGHPLMSERERIVAPVVDSPKPPPRRLTMTLPLLLRARQTIVTALSPDKRPVLDAALRPDAADLPITRIFRHAPDVLVLAAP